MIESKPNGMPCKIFKAILNLKLRTAKLNEEYIYLPNHQILVKTGGNQQKYFTCYDHVVGQD